MRWTIKPKPDQRKVQQLMDALQVDAIVASLLVQRGIETYDQAKLFFRPALSDLHDPFLMRDMDTAVDRIEEAIKNNEGILVYGDYDVDGTTSVAMMSLFLETLSDKIATYIPDRYTEGYGISNAGIDFAADNDLKLVIALDCGIKAQDQVAYAREKDIDFIICDHHRPGEVLPDAVAVLDPKREDCSYPFDELCGCGVGFKLIQAIALKKEISLDEITPLLDLVVTAIAADIVPVNGENRTLAYFGMQVLNDEPRLGIKVMIRSLNKPVISITDVVFVIAPRINAAGRMKHAEHALRLLRASNMEDANELALEIEKYNISRKEADHLITEAALKQIEADEEQGRFSTVVYDPDWHKGVLGIVASRLIETYYRPTVVFSKSGDQLTGSARSVRGFDVYEALQKCKSHIVRFGGHKYAAGLTIQENEYEAFKAAFEKAVSSEITEAMRTPEIKIDTEIDLSQVDQRLYRIISQFAPFGPGNMMPVFMSKELHDTGNVKCVGADRKHIKMSVSKNGRNPIDAIGFNLGDKQELVRNSRPFKAAFSIDENYWNGVRSLQLKLRDIKT